MTTLEELKQQSYSRANKEIRRRKTIKNVLSIFNGCCIVMGAGMGFGPPPKPDVTQNAIAIVLYIILLLELVYLWLPKPLLKRICFLVTACLAIPAGIALLNSVLDNKRDAWAVYGAISLIIGATWTTYLLIPKLRNHPLAIQLRTPTHKINLFLKRNYDLIAVWLGAAIITIVALITMNTGHYYAGYRTAGNVFSHVSIATTATVLGVIYTYRAKNK